MSPDQGVFLLAYWTRKITLYCPILIITIGTIGCICNFLTFTSLKLRRSSCSIYFLGAAIFELLTLDFGALTRLLADYFGTSLFNQSQVYCKIRQFLVTLLPAIATCFIVLATMDRYMSTSSKLIYRAFATVKRAKWIITFSLTICSLSYSHYLIFANLRPLCTLQPGVYSIFTVIYGIIWTSLIPHCLMLYFGIGTQSHIHSIRRRIVPANNRQRRSQRTETHLATMILFQVSVSSFLIFTRTAYYTYSVITTNVQKSDFQLALDALLSQITTQLFYLNYAKSFYIYTLSSNYFRSVFGKRMKLLFYLVTCHRRNNTVIHRRPLNTQRNV